MIRGSNYQAGGYTNKFKQAEMENNLRDQGFSTHGYNSSLTRHVQEKTHKALIERTRLKEENDAKV